MDKALYVGLGGFIGSVLRYWVSGAVQQLTNNPTFPVGTVVVNLFGCLVIGFLAQIADTRNIFTPEARLFVFVGILGGFTTFSSFGNETMNLLRGGQGFQALVNVTSHVVAGLGAVWLGRSIADWLWRL
jgi:CrcB protein